MVFVLFFNSSKSVAAPINSAETYDPTSECSKARGSLHTASGLVVTASSKGFAALNWYLSCFRNSFTNLNLNFFRVGFRNTNSVRLSLCLLLALNYRDFASTHLRNANGYRDFPSSGFQSALLNWNRTGFWLANHFANKNLTGLCFHSSFHDFASACTGFRTILTDSHFTRLGFTDHFEYRTFTRTCLNATTTYRHRSCSSFFPHLRARNRPSCQASKTGVFSLLLPNARVCLTLRAKPSTFRIRGKIITKFSAVEKPICWL